jgi:hypothetical protein
MDARHIRCPPSAPANSQRVRGDIVIMYVDGLNGFRISERPENLHEIGDFPILGKVFIVLLCAVMLDARRAYRMPLSSILAVALNAPSEFYSSYKTLFRLAPAFYAYLRPVNSLHTTSNTLAHTI